MWNSDADYHRRSSQVRQILGIGPAIFRRPSVAPACALMALALVVGAGEAIAAGFFLQQQSVRSVGRAHAGQAAIAEDASTIFFNPAGLTELERAEVEVGGHVITPHTDLDNRGSTATTPGTGGVPVSLDGNDGGNPFDPTPVVNLYVAAPMPGNRAWVGLGVTAPFGLFVEYDNIWFGRYDSTNTELLTLDIAPTFAYRVNDMLSIGAGIDVQYVDGTLENAIPNPLQAGGPTAASDGHFKAKGDDWSVGFNVGLLIKPSSRTRVGLHYRSTMTHGLEGKATTSGLTGALAGLNGTVPVSAEINLPDVAAVAVAHEVTPRLTVLGHVAWFGWDRFDELRIKFANGNPDAVTPENYEDSWSVALGVEYALSDTWQLRSGFQFDETPTVTGSRDTRVPDENRYWVAGGASYALSDRWEIDLSYAHVFLEDADIDLTRTFFATAPAVTSTSEINAESDTQVDIISVQVRARF
jgi:long-chain fatty acid transport protein